MNYLVAEGMQRDDIPKANICCAAFHPTEDIWWVLFLDPFPCYLGLTIVNKEVKRIEEVLDVEAGIEWLLRKRVSRSK